MKTLFRIFAVTTLAALLITPVHAEHEKSSGDQSHKVVFEVSIDGGPHTVE